MANTLYQPLGEQAAIRLIRLTPERHDSEIHCEMETVFLRDRPGYCALSCTWGPFGGLGVALGMTSERTHAIKCNPCSVQVTENLHAFLLRFKSDDQREEWLWIDAVCINQDDHLERTAQVSLMDQIYRGVKLVISWLGDEDEWTEDGFAMMKSIARNPEQPLFAQDPAGCHAMDCVFTMRSYFTRSWIVQEILLARQIVVKCGPHSIDWGDLVTACRSKVSPSLMLIFPQLLVGDTGRSIPVLWEDQRKVESRSLLDAVAVIRRFDSTDPRDKVYAALGLCSTFDEALGSQTEQQIVPRYGSKSAAEAYLEVAQTMILNSADGDELAVLSYAESRQSEHSTGLPSWVPDWSVALELGVGSAAYQSFNAGHTLPQTRTILEPGSSKLAITGIKLDRVVAVGETKDQLFRREKPCTDLAAIIGKMRDLYHTGETKLEAVWRSLINDFAGTPPVHPAPPEYGVQFRNWIQRHQSISQLFGGGLVSYADTGLPETSIYDFDTAFTRARYQRPFLTARGYLGASSESTLPGDSIWVASGSRIPLTLRALNGEEGPTKTWRLVGGAYLHGFMHGEVADVIDISAPETILLE